MTNLKQKKKSGVNPVFAVVTGAVVGAGVAVAGAIALKDKKNRDKVKKVLTNVKNQAVGYMEKAAATTKRKIKKVVKKDVVKGVKKI